MNVSRLPESTLEVALGREIRDHVKALKSPIDFSIRNFDDDRILSSILSAPHFLSGLTPAEHDLVKLKAIERRHPETYQSAEQLSRSRDQTRQGFQALRQLICERAGAKLGDDDQIYGGHEQTPPRRLTAVNS